MTDILQRALGISRSRRALEMIAGAQGGHFSAKWITLRIRREFANFIRLAPSDPAGHVRYTEMEKLYGCIRIVQRGKGALKRKALQEGLKTAGHTLTDAHVGNRYGWLRPVANKNGGRRGDYEPGDEGTTEGALAAMVEASRVLRGGNRFHAECMAYDGIGGEDMRDHAPGFKQGECGWGADTKRLNATRPETRGRRDWVF